MPEVLAADDPATCERVTEVLRDGRLAVLPVEGVYAVVADAFSRLGTQRLFGAKAASRQTPLPVVIRSPRQVIGLVADVPEAAERLMAAYWPGPLTIVFRADDGLSWDLGETRGTVALRMPTEDLLLRVVAAVGPLACTGANRRGEVPPSTVAGAEVQLGEQVACYVDGGERDGSVSTVVDVTLGNAGVLRVGTVPAADVAQVAHGQTPWGARPVPDSETEKK